MNPQPSVILFYVIALLSLGGALGVLFTKNIVYAIFFMFLALLGVGIGYGYLGADFIAVIQILLYVGGVVVLFLFAIMMTKGLAQDIKATNTSLVLPWALVLCSIFGTILGYLILITPWPQKANVPEPTTKSLGELLLGRYLLPFEVITILLLVVLIGAVAIIRKEIRGER